MRMTPREQVKEISSRVGKPEARRLLVLEGISPSVADKLLGERYPSEIGSLVGIAIARALAAAKKLEAS